MSKKIFFWVFLILLFFGLLLGGFLGFRYFRNRFFQPLAITGGKINFLLLGVNQTDSTDKNLTDTMIFTSISLEKRKVVLISLPRDIWIESIKAKINAAYHYGGINLTKKVIAEVTGQEVNYFAVINFDSFEKIIDYFGGIEVNVERAFEDLKFPIPGKEKDLCDGDRQLKCRYEHLVFEAGKQLMDGKTALKFVRSRNAQGEEGSDFARSARQQKVLMAIKDKIISEKLYSNPEKALGLLELLQKEVITDIKPEIYGSLTLLGYDLSKNGTSVEMVTLNGNLLINPRYHYSRQWVLLPKGGNWKSLQAYVEDILN